MGNHIIEHVIGWRVKDYDGYNDYYTDTNNYYRLGQVGSRRGGEICKYKYLKSRKDGGT